MQAHDSNQMEALRALVAEKFPHPRRLGSRLPVGCNGLDQKGGFLRSAVTEVCGSSASGPLLLAAVVNAAVREGFFIALIDAANSFEPSDYRCTTPSCPLGDVRWRCPARQSERQTFCCEMAIYH